MWGGDAGGAVCGGSGKCLEYLLEVRDMLQGGSKSGEYPIVYSTVCMRALLHRHPRQRANKCVYRSTWMHVVHVVCYGVRGAYGACGACGAYVHVVHVMHAT